VKVVESDFDGRLDTTAFIGILPDQTEQLRLNVRPRSAGSSVPLAIRLEYTRPDGAVITRIIEATVPVHDRDSRSITSEREVGPGTRIQVHQDAAFMEAGGPTHAQIRDILLNCAPLESDQTIKYLFADERLFPWRYLVPGGRNKQERAEALISLLREKQNIAGENALGLFLLVAADRLHEQDKCRSELTALAEKLLGTRTERTEKRQGGMAQ